MKAVRFENYGDVDVLEVVEQTGRGDERRRAGDEVIGFTNRRASHAELVVVAAENQPSARSAGS